MKRFFLSLVFLFSVMLMIGANPIQYDVGTKNEVKVFVQSVNNQTTLHVATVNLKTLDVSEIHRDIATVTAFKQIAGVVGIRTVYNRCEYLFYPSKRLYSLTNYKIKHYKNIFAVPIDRKWKSENKQNKKEFYTSGGLSYLCHC